MKIVNVKLRVIKYDCSECNALSHIMLIEYGYHICFIQISIIIIRMRGIFDKALCVQQDTQTLRYTCPYSSLVIQLNEIKRKYNTKILI